MTASATISNFGKFLGRHAGELRSLTGVISSILSALPIEASSKAGIEKTLEGIEAAADRIEKAAPAQTEAVVRKSDVEAAVKAVLSDVVATEIAKQLGKVKASNGPKKDA